MSVNHGADAVAKGSGVLDAHQVAALLGAHVVTVRRLARRHEIPAFKVGREWRFSESALQRWIETHHIRAREPVILVLDDEADTRNMLRTILEPEGYRVVTTATGTEAFAAVQRDAPDVLILSFDASNTSGVEVFRQFRQTQPDIPVVVATTYPEGELIVEALRYPPVILLPKPLEDQVVRKTVRLMLDGARRQP